MMQAGYIFVCVFSISILTVTSANADLFFLQPGAVDGKDTWVVRGGEPDTTFRAHFNYGATTLMSVGQTGTSGQFERILIQFDLPNLPSGHTIQSARLGLTVIGGHGGLTSTPIEVYRFHQSWSEGTGTGSATADGATWQTHDGTNSWPGMSGFRTTDGGGYSLASAEINDPMASHLLTRNLSQSSTLNWIDLDPQKVEQWMDGSFVNQGMLIRSPNETSGSTQLHIASSDHATAQWRPVLEIQTAVPEPGIGSLLLLALIGSAFFHRARRPTVSQFDRS